MERWVYILIAVLILVVLTIIFFVTYVAYKKTPAPKGCESLAVPVEECKGCQNTSCDFYRRVGEREKENKGEQ